MSGPGPSSALVVGGGIAGLATALALEKGGVDVTVMERDPQPIAGGALLLWPGAVRALRPLGAGSVRYQVCEEESADLIALEEERLGRLPGF